MTSSLSELDDQCKKLSAMPGVQGYVVLDNQGCPIRSDQRFDKEMLSQFTPLVSRLVQKTRRCVSDLDQTNDLTFIRVRTLKHEIMIAPEREYQLVAIQKPDIDGAK